MSSFDSAVTAPIIVGVLLLLFEYWLNHHDDRK
ncbi:type I toxin-antitoxin system Fst family toxin [Lacticaseibacillus paracasei]|nr:MULTISPECIES: type I toxin-antitoxin system Fst family toxin [Lactobacillaceae]MBA4475465.1 type I toxin-antitoxin system Fst family toxin [Lacticaseibacillus paracasei]MBU6045541.1 type I toxin-antitoxin system Fst family toxin [Lacticaseibacillus paracasei]MBU6048175.1 type I toxin-antitoxin system Fst family toxin [Lacticaseibacillus paracasei]MCD5536235.1 type I toxin-antitoxin system Fst family toxin [Lactobacillus delbrueckii subsp. sunkii]MCL4970362.1 type I toxin-antitoxin system Fs